MTQFRPKYITFDCYGTLTFFQMANVAHEIFSDRVAADKIDAFIGNKGWNVYSSKKLGTGCDQQVETRNLHT